MSKKIGCIIEGGWDLLFFLEEVLKKINNKTVIELLIEKYYKSSNK